MSVTIVLRPGIADVCGTPAGNWTDVARYVMEGDARGAVNAISVEGMWTLNTTAGVAKLVVNHDKVALHKRIWQGSLAKARGIRTYPIIGFVACVMLVSRSLFPCPCGC